MSKQLLFHLNEYVKENKKLCFIEALFPSLSHRHNLIYQLCDEFSELHWRKDWNISDFDRTKIFHPLKNIEQQNEIRCLLHISNKYN